MYIKKEALTVRRVREARRVFHWQSSQIVRGWIREHNGDVKQTGKRRFVIRA